MACILLFGRQLGCFWSVQSRRLVPHSRRQCDRHWRLIVDRVCVPVCSRWQHSETKQWRMYGSTLRLTTEGRVLWSAFSPASVRVRCAGTKIDRSQSFLTRFRRLSAHRPWFGTGKACACVLVSSGHAFWFHGRKFSVSCCAAGCGRLHHARRCGVIISTSKQFKQRQKTFLVVSF